MRSENDIRQRLWGLEDSHLPHAATPDCDVCNEIDVLQWILEEEVMTVRNLIDKLLMHSVDRTVCSSTGEDVTIGILNFDGSAIHLITIPAKEDLRR